MFLYALACATAEDSAKTGETGITDSEPTSSETCEAKLKSTYPEDGEDDAYYKTTIEFELSAEDPTATVDAPFGGSLSWSEDNKTAIFTPDADLEPDTSYTVTLNYCGGAEPITFSTGSLGQAVESAAINGRTYLLDLGTATVTDPPGVTDILKSQLDVGILTGVTVLENGDLSILGALENDDTSGVTDQNYCDPAIVFPDADFSASPYFVIAGSSVTFDIQGYAVELLDLEITGTFAADGSYFGGGTLAGTADTRAFDDLAGGGEGAVCDLVSAFMVECEPCASDGEPFCLSIKARDIRAELEEDVTLVPIVGTDCAGCSAGVPADYSETCPTE